MNGQEKTAQNPRSGFLVFAIVALLVGTMAYGNQAWAGTKYFWVFAKSSIQKPGSNTSEAPPSSLGLNVSNYYTFLGQTRDGCSPIPCPPAPFDERPNMGTISGSDSPSGQYRIFGEFRIKGSCTGSSANKPTYSWKDERGGWEGGALYGSVDLQGAVKSIGGAWVVNYVLSGQPHSVIETTSFTPVKSRTNKKIFQKGQVVMGCTSSGTPTAFMSSSSSVWGGSKFPTHNASLWNATSAGATSLRQTLKKTQGKFWELWNLPTVPSP